MDELAEVGEIIMPACYCNSISIIFKAIYEVMRI
jgi:hypothetical protein